MSTNQNKETARRYYDEVLNQGNLDVLDQLAGKEFDEHDPLPGQGTGLDGLRDRVNMLRTGLAGTYSIQDMVAEGDKVVVRWLNSGTNSGEFFGMPPTGRDFTMAGIDVIRFEDGKMAEHWHVVDQLALLIQLGVVELPGPPPQ